MSPFLRYNFSPFMCFRRLTCLLSLCSLVLLTALPVWSGLTDFSQGLLDAMQKRFGQEAPRRLLQFQAVINQTKRNFSAAMQTADGRVELALLRRVNDILNKVPYMTDQEHWGVPDYWATPVEMIASWGGDCEDYAIAKYMTLKDLGVPIDRLRITYVRAIQIGETHMVLAYYQTPSADPLILDNLTDEVLPASQRTDLIPVYSFNDDDLWLPNGGNRKGGASTVRLWRDLIEKMEKEKRM